VGDFLIILVIVLVIALVWRGPKTIPQIGAMLGRGFRAAREEARDIRRDAGDEDKPPTP
jgi:Sec-independent protein translocase protein TatA